jgi:hypothetical protein
VRKIGAGQSDGLKISRAAIVTEIRVATPEHRRDVNDGQSGGRQIEAARPDDSSCHNEILHGVGREKSWQRGQNVGETTALGITAAVAEKSRWGQ